MKIKLIVLFFFLYLFSLMITLPASTLTRFIPQSAGLKIAGVSGYAWQGEAALLTYNKEHNFERVSWGLDWSALTTLQVKLHVKFNNGRNAMSGEGIVKSGFWGKGVENLKLDLSAAQLLSYVDLPVPIEASGDIAITVKDATLGDPYCATLDGFVNWENARISSQVGDVDLATTNINLSCENGEPVAFIKQQSEQISSNISALLQKGGLYKLQGTINASDKLNPDIRQALNWIGPKDSTGATLLNFNGRL
ncbi:type II secretion system protein N [Psychromonas sp.]|uniref:type II secretion system protein N n=1 Tax=Psychromonas sp. TaxID=1884585 RepID=UPI00356B54B6